MTWERNWNQRYSWLSKKFGYPDDRLHCDLCGWYPRNGVWGLRKDTCCNLLIYRASQTSLMQFCEEL